MAKIKGVRSKDTLVENLTWIVDNQPAIEIDDNADKEGEWIGGRVRSYPGYTCSLCGYSVEPWNTTKGCPNCGAKMKGAEND